MFDHRFKASAAILVALFLAGCSTQVALENPTIPSPLIDKLPMTVAARYPERFNNFVHEEQVIGKKKWTIDMGRANRLLFTKLFSSMFTDFSVVSQDADPKTLGVDAFIEPSIDAFEFSVPNQSQTDAFAVWIRYRIKIFDGDGTEVANWPISAYGKSLSSGMSNDDALRRAAVLAMRDAAALIILQMDKATGISALRDARQRRASDGMRAGDAEASSRPVQTTAVEDKNDDSGL